MDMKSSAISIAKDILSTLVIVAVIVAIGILITGTWPFMVAVESGSMEPNMHRGDVIFLVSPDRTDIITYIEGAQKGYKSFGDYGDVIVYKPNGDDRRTPIIHRVIAYVQKGENIPIKVGNRILLTKNIAPNSGYITQGDYNGVPDQPFVSKPIKKEWIVGVAKFRIPYIGYFRLLFS
jgi:signal peptidase